MRKLFKIAVSSSPKKIKVKRALHVIDDPMPIYVSGETLEIDPNTSYKLNDLPDYWGVAIKGKRTRVDGVEEDPILGVCRTILIVPVKSMLFCYVDSYDRISVKKYDELFPLVHKICEIKDRQRQQITSVSHELRTPLNTILGYANMLEHTNLDEFQTVSVNNIITSANNLARLISDIIDVDKIESNKVVTRYAPTNIKTMIDQCYKIAKESQKDGVSYDVFISPDIPDVVIADGARTSQIIINVVNNAFKFTNKGHVKLSIKESDDIPYTPVPANLEKYSASVGGEIKYITFSIRDTGIGIKEKDIKKLFRAFVRLEESYVEGTGLGLAISSGLTKLLGGKIGVQSEWGIGSTFQFTIPVLIDPSIAVDYSILAGINVLIVDDNEKNINHLTEILDKYSINYRECTSGERAIRSYVNNKRHNFDLGLIDICMPKMNGNALAEYIYGCDKPFPLIGLTSTDDVSDKFEHHIHKPYNEFELIHAMYSVLYNSPKRSKEEKPILVVEDNAFGRAMLVDTLKLLGKKNIHTAVDGEQAVNMCISEEGGYSIVFMDILMPNLDGYMATVKIKELMGDSRPKIVAVTANVQDRDKYINMMDHYLPKPIDMQLLKKILTSCS